MYERKRKSIRERFEEKINKDGPVQPHMDTACWEWTAGKSRQGYGRLFELNTGQLRAHRVSWVLHNGEPIPEGLLVLHECDNPSCVNPAHLFLGTYQNNTDDMIRKRRGYFPGVKNPRGSQNGMAKLTEDQVLQIRELYQSTQFTQVELGNRFGITNSVINKIVNRNSWSHI